MPDIHDLLEGFLADAIEEERKRWRPLHQLLTDKEETLRRNRTELADKKARLDARAQYELVKELLAAAPTLPSAIPSPT